ncbi:MAG: alpha-hydroxy-acid oxidizing protein, partial [Bacilli bacterium]
DVVMISSGGITNALHIAQSIALGASAVGMAGPILKVVINEGVNAAVNFIERLKEQLCFIMTALGTETIRELQQTPIVITGQTREWCDMRMIDIRSLATRSKQ